MEILTDIDFYIMRVKEWQQNNPKGALSYDSVIMILKELRRIAVMIEKEKEKE